MAAVPLSSSLCLPVVTMRRGVTEIIQQGLWNSHNFTEKENHKNAN
jgi:hypothetical protein